MDEGITMDDVVRTKSVASGGELSVTPTSTLNNDFNFQDSSKTILYVVAAVIGIFLLMRILKTQHIIK